MISSILDHKNVALANIGWALLHVWIALEIEESMGFLAIVLVIGGIFALSWRLEGKNGRRIMLLPSLLYLLVLPAVIGSDHRGDGVQRLCLAGPDRPYHLGVDHSGHTTGIHARVDRYRSL